MATRVKICGLTRPVDIAAARGAAYVGFVFFDKSPRNVTIPLAKSLAGSVPSGQCKVALTVDADDATLDAIMADVPLDMIQLNGSETPDRVAEVRTRTGLPVMKAVGIANEADLAGLGDFMAVADQILLDAKPPKGADRPGGNGQPFDWRLLSGRRWSLPWMLAGGLNAGNVAEAVRLTGARQVDISSGVESAPGIKDAGLIADFIAAAG